MGTAKKASHTKTYDSKATYVWHDPTWKLRAGELKRKRGRPPGKSNLLSLVAEKLPWEALANVKKHCIERGDVRGVYIAHDSIGCPRYAGRGDVFGRLAAHKKKHGNVLSYFSVFLVPERNHEREIETLLLRGSGFTLLLNDRKIRSDASIGDINDFEPGTLFIERREKKKRKTAKKKRKTASTSTPKAGKAGTAKKKPTPKKPTPKKASTKKALKR